MSEHFWSKVTVAIESAIGADLTISGITKADPAVASFAADPSLSAGDYIYLECLGMTELNGRVVRVANPAGSGPYTVELEDIDSTLYGTFSSGTANKLTFGTTLSDVLASEPEGGQAEYYTWQYLAETSQRRRATRYTPWSMRLEKAWDPTDATHATLLTAADTFAKKAVKLTFSSGPIVVFRGAVAFSGEPQGAVGELARTPVEISCDGRPMYYGS